MFFQKEKKIKEKIYFFWFELVSFFIFTVYVSFDVLYDTKFVIIKMLLITICVFDWKCFWISIKMKFKQKNNFLDLLFVLFWWWKRKICQTLKKIWITMVNFNCLIGYIWLNWWWNIYLMCFVEYLLKCVVDFNIFIL